MTSRKGLPRRSPHQNVMLDVPTDIAGRKASPIMTGVVDYFPAALCAVAHLSRVGSRRHNPDAPMHWDRAKSPDHADALLRHLMERGTTDADGIRHTTKVAWRALALLQEELEAAAGFVPEGAPPFPAPAAAAAAILPLRRGQPAPDRQP